MPKNPLTLPCIILSCACALSLICSIALTAQRLREPKTDTATQDNSVQNAVQHGEVLPEELDSDKEIVYIYDNGTYKSVYPIIQNAPRSDWDMELLEINDKTKRRALYGENGEKRTKFGVDVSSYQGVIDWEKAAADGVEFAFIRAAYRGYETGRLVEDTQFRRNYEQAKAAGVDVGFYIFSQAITPEEGIEEAEFVLSLMEEIGAEPELPIVFDWEHPSADDPARTDSLTGEEQTECCMAFCKRIREAGYEPAYYTTISMALFRYDLEELADVPLWLAEYSETTSFPYKFKIWQYTSSGIVDGIEALTDLNIMEY